MRIGKTSILLADKTFTLRLTLAYQTILVSNIESHVVDLAALH